MLLLAVSMMVFLVVCLSGALILGDFFVLGLWCCEFDGISSMLSAGVGVLSVLDVWFSGGSSMVVW